MLVGSSAFTSSLSSVRFHCGVIRREVAVLWDIWLSIFRGLDSFLRKLPPLSHMMECNPDGQLSQSPVCGRGLEISLLTVNSVNISVIHREPTVFCGV